MLRPLKVTFELDTPMMVAAYPIHLDALLAFAVTKSAMSGMSMEGVPDSSIRALASELPFARHEQNGEWVWKASALIPEVEGEQSVRMWTRKTNTSDFARRAAAGTLDISTRTKNALASGVMYAGTIDTSRGLLKNQFEFYPVKEVFQLSAWCIGDIDLIETLLAPESGFITHLGKRGRIGHGRIRSVEVEECLQANEKWKLRVLPWAESEAYAPIHAACRAPYWAIENRQPAFVPVVL